MASRATKGAGPQRVIGDWGVTCIAEHGGRLMPPESKLHRRSTMERTATGPLAWTFPAALNLFALTALSWMMFAGLSRSNAPACELMDRVAWLFAAGAATAAFLLPFTYIRRAWLRLLVAALAGGVAAAAAWELTVMLFPQFC
jgi:peptidoglycan/LPS O-acetylase OafA/YrhL